MAKKYKTVQVRMSLDVLARMQKKCEDEGLGFYSYAGDLLEKAFLYDYKGKSDQLLAPHIRNVVREEVNGMMESMMEVLTRTYLESGTGRRLIQTNLTLSPDITREEVIELQKRNWDNAYKQLRDDIQGVGDWRRLLVSDPLASQSEGEEE